MQRESSSSTPAVSDAERPPVHAQELADARRGDRVVVAADHEDLLGATDRLLGREHRVACPERLPLVDERHRHAQAPRPDLLANLVGPVRDDEHQPVRTGCQRVLDRVPEERTTAQRVQHLRRRRLQSFALAGREDDRGQRSAASTGARGSFRSGGTLFVPRTAGVATRAPLRAPPGARPRRVERGRRVEGLRGGLGDREDDRASRLQMRARVARSPETVERSCCHAVSAPLGAPARRRLLPPRPPLRPARRRRSRPSRSSAASARCGSPTPATPPVRGTRSPRGRPRGRGRPHRPPTSVCEDLGPSGPRDVEHGLTGFSTEPNSQCRPRGRRPPPPRGRRTRRRATAGSSPRAPRTGQPSSGSSRRRSNAQVSAMTSCMTFCPMILLRGAPSSRRMAMPSKRRGSRRRVARPDSQLGAVVERERQIAPVADLGRDRDRLLGRLHRLVVATDEAKQPRNHVVQRDHRLCPSSRSSRSASSPGRDRPERHRGRSAGSARRRGGRAPGPRGRRSGSRCGAPPRGSREPPGTRRARTASSRPCRAGAPPARASLTSRAASSATGSSACRLRRTGRAATACASAASAAASPSASPASRRARATCRSRHAPPRSARIKVTRYFASATLARIARSPVSAGGRRGPIEPLPRSRPRRRRPEVTVPRHHRVPGRAGVVTRSLAAWWARTSPNSSALPGVASSIHDATRACASARRARRQAGVGDVPGQDAARRRAPLAADRRGRSNTSPLPNRPLSASDVDPSTRRAPSQNTRPTTEAP